MGPPCCLVMEVCAKHRVISSHHHSFPRGQRIISSHQHSFMQTHRVHLLASSLLT
jgi:hypothetical protein